MTALAPAPGTPEWARLMTASKIAAVLGVSTYDSPRSMWHKMRGDIPWDADDDQKRRGHYLEPAILAWWRDQHPEYPRVRHQVYAPHPTLPYAAATLDLFAPGNRRARRDPAIVEAKSSIKPDEWGEPGTDAVPTEYAMQAYWQMACTPTAARVYLPVIGSYLRFTEYVVERDDTIIDDLVARCALFYGSLASDVPPPLDDHVATFDALKALHPDIERGVTVELTLDQAREYVHAGVATKAATARETAAKSVLLDRMGRAQYAAVNGVRVARRQPNRSGVSLTVTAAPTDLPERTTP